MSSCTVQQCRLVYCINRIQALVQVCDLLFAFVFLSICLNVSVVYHIEI